MVFGVQKRRSSKRGPIFLSARDIPWRRGHLHAFKKVSRNTKILCKLRRYQQLCVLRISPRAVILLGAALQVAAGIALALQPVYEVHCALKFLIGLSACIMFSAAFQISRYLLSTYTFAAFKCEIECINILKIRCFCVFYLHCLNIIDIII